MGMPTKEKTWQYGPSGDPSAFLNQLTGDTTIDLTCKKTMWAIKESLIGFTTQPWTVVGSCDGSSNFDNIPATSNDYWVAATNLIWGTTGNHSWIVLKQTGVGSNFQICIELKGVVPYYAVIAFSASAGFTGGALNARPTATDEVVVINSQDWHWGNTNYAPALHVMQSTDGECTRIIACVNSTANMFVDISKPKNPSSGWSNPSIMTWVRYQAGAGEATSYAVLNDLANVFSYIGSDAAKHYMSTIGCVDRMNGQYIGGFNQLENAYEVYPIWLFATTASALNRRGTHGQIYDLWFGTVDGITTGDTYPGTGKEYAQFGDLVVPWDGVSTPQVGG